ncbi:MAG: polysaccharide deacetylase family protein [Muribaculaceae bacterium]
MKLLFNTLAAAVLLCASAAFACDTGSDDCFDRHGAMVCHNASQRVIYPVFSADSLCEGLPFILQTLEQRGLQASFFFTGNFLRDSTHQQLIQRVIAGGHYVGGHSDRHLQLAEWDDQRTARVTIDSMLCDVDDNLRLLAAEWGIPEDSCRWFLPPFEWINAEQSAALRQRGLKVINPTPGIQIYRDYTVPGMAEYHSSDSIITQLFEYERANTLNGVILIVHPGTQDLRTDKLYLRLPQIIDSLSAMGYRFSRL